MNPEAQRIAIAEHCGWKKQATKVLKTGGNKWIWISPLSHYSAHPPDYLNDLNAMREAVRTLPENLHVTFNTKLYILLDYERNPNWMFDALTARADKLAEAFLCTIEKWTEE